jgi:hypothetical protein
MKGIVSGDNAGRLSQRRDAARHHLLTKLRGDERTAVQRKNLGGSEVFRVSGQRGWIDEWSRIYVFGAIF